MHSPDHAPVACKIRQRGVPKAASLRVYMNAIVSVLAKESVEREEKPNGTGKWKVVSPITSVTKELPISAQGFPCAQDFALDTTASPKGRRRPQHRLGSRRFQFIQNVENQHLHCS